MAIDTGAILCSAIIWKIGIGAANRDRIRDEIREVNGYFMLIPTINSYGKILSSLDYKVIA